jgi:hypothetical protein
MATKYLSLNLTIIDVLKTNTGSRGIGQNHHSKIGLINKAGCSYIETLFTLGLDHIKLICLSRQTEPYIHGFEDRQLKLSQSV